MINFTKNLLHRQQVQVGDICETVAVCSWILFGLPKPLWLRRAYSCIGYIKVTCFLTSGAKFVKCTPVIHKMIFRYRIISYLSILLDQKTGVHKFIQWIPSSLANMHILKSQSKSVFFNLQTNSPFKLKFKNQLFVNKSWLLWLFTKRLLLK